MKKIHFLKRSLLLTAVVFAFLPTQFLRSSQLTASYANRASPSRLSRQFTSSSISRFLAYEDRSILDIGSVFDLVTSPVLPGLVFLYSDGSHPFIYGKTEQGCWQGLDSSPIEYDWDTRIGLTATNGLPRFLANTFPGVVSRTDNYGAFWEYGALPTSRNLTSGPIEASPIKPNEIYAALGTVINDPIVGPITYGELYVSEDGASTWKLLEAIYTNFGPLLPSPVISGRIYVHKSFAAGTSSSSDWYVYEPVLGWTHLAIDGHHKLVLDPLDPNILYAWDPETQGSYRIVNGDRIDGAVVNGDDNAIFLAHPGRSGMLFLQSTSGVYRSLDGGDHWKMLIHSLGGLLYVDFNFGGRLLLSKADGIYVSTDFGETWEERISYADADGCPRDSRFYFPLVFYKSIIQ